MNYYFANQYVIDENGSKVLSCIAHVERYEMNPLRWFITRHLATIFWYIGEIIGDWYTLFRTKILVKGEKSLFLIYITCGIFNITKLILIGYYLSLGPSRLYNRDGVLDKLNTINYDNHSFLSKFRTISEFRIFVSVEPSAESMDSKKLNLYIMAKGSINDDLKTFDSMVDYQYGINLDLNMKFIKYKNDINNNGNKNNNNNNNDDDNQEFNNNEIKNDVINNEEMNNDAIKNDAVKNEEMNNEEMNNDAIKNDAVKNEEMNNEEMNNDAIKNEEININIINNNTNTNTNTTSTNNNNNNNNNNKDNIR
ncbi:hypothetical protein PIROE2DRAFT_19296 [Piromyces sp. E2]|nr:hypothetical protein PIROE2DRAFT_19296 [Piromyces sp. E2]|eukprot:OUM56201.1 hypothetical protein PIROE2DRAFT_19296 [Piromyces sp. E2]